MRVRRARAKIFGTSQKPRLAVFRSNRHMYAQLIDDGSGRTIASASTRELESGAKKGKADRAALIGEAIAKKAIKGGVSAAVFDRRSYKYHGRVKALADSARKAGLKF